MRGASVIYPPIIRFWRHECHFRAPRLTRQKVNGSAVAAPAPLAAKTESPLCVCLLSLSGCFPFLFVFGEHQSERIVQVVGYKACVGGVVGRVAAVGRESFRGCKVINNIAVVSK